MNAKRELNFPQSRRSGTRINSSVFIVAMMRICRIALKRDLNPLKIQIPITISESPIKMVSSLECVIPKILSAICSCRGTRFNTLQRSPFANQMSAMQTVRILLSVAFDTITYLFAFHNSRNLFL